MPDSARCLIKDYVGDSSDVGKRGKSGSTITLIGTPGSHAQGLHRINGVRLGLYGMYLVSEPMHSFRGVKGG